jgi:hypothetical protein
MHLLQATRHGARVLTYCLSDGRVRVDKDMSCMGATMRWWRDRSGGDLAVEMTVAMAVMMAAVMVMVMVMVMVKWSIKKEV